MLNPIAIYCLFLFLSFLLKPQIPVVLRSGHICEFFETSNAPLERLLAHYNKPRPATPSFIMMIATNTGSRPSNQLAILQQALKERVKKCVLLQNPCSTSYGRQITFKDFYMM